MARVGHVRVFAALLSLGSTAPLAHAVFVEPVAWFAIRLLTGYCFAGAFVVAESWLNVAGSNENRGTLLSAYMTVQLGALTLGQFLLDLADPGEATLFMLVSALVTVAAVPMLLTAAPAPVIQAPRGVSLTELYRLSPLGVVGVVGVGFSSGAIYGVGPVFARAAGLAVALTSAFMAAIVAGGMVLAGAGRLGVGPVRPAGGDRGRHLPGGARGGVVAGPGPAARLVAVRPVLPGRRHGAADVRALRRARERLPAQGPDGRGRRARSSCPTASAPRSGPPWRRCAFQALGPAGYPLFLAAVHAGIGGFALWRMTRRPAVPAEDRAPPWRSRHPRRS